MSDVSGVWCEWCVASGVLCRCGGVHTVCVCVCYGG